MHFLFPFLIQLRNWHCWKRAGMEGFSKQRPYSVSTAPAHPYPVLWNHPSLDRDVPQPSVSVHARYRDSHLSPAGACRCRVGQVQPSIIQRSHSLCKRAKKRPWHHRRDPSIPSPASLEISNQPYRSSYLCHLSPPFHRAQYCI